MEILWAGWRSAYMRAVTEQEASDADDASCLFCALPDKGSDEETLVIARGELVYSVMNLYPYTTGHLMVAPYRHIGSPGKASHDEQLEMWDFLARSQRSLEVALDPDGFNLGANVGRDAGAGVLGHLHLHVVPRWRGDANFMTTSANVRILPESIQETRSRLVEAFNKLG
ncbi:MAG: HIT domain-containing protein [Acidimicrobiia bacterium]|nr:HIT domain-containing protein [Acidimicrobiia bacterium]NNL29195.1 HIT domain-containing protein [Acidimicrobiia bacterium]